MPKRKRTNYRRVRRKRRRISRRRRRRGVPRGIIPNTRLVKHRYVDNDVYLNSTSGGSPATYVFSANGMYDPDITGVGHQPLGFDEMTTLYNHFTVVGCKITYTIVSQDNGYAHIVAVKLGTDTTPTADMENLLENGKCRWALLPRADGGVVKKLTLRVNPNKFLGISKPMSEDDLKGTAAENPAKQAYLQLSCGPLQAQDTYGVRGQVVIEYTAVWTSPKLLTES